MIGVHSSKYEVNMCTYQYLLVAVLGWVDSVTSKFLAAVAAPLETAHTVIAAPSVPDNSVN